MRAAFIGLILATLGACTPANQDSFQTLPSGKSIKVLRVLPMQSATGGNRWLVLQYQTALSLDDIPALKSEADEIWPYFKNDVEKAGLNEALITAFSEPKGAVVQASDTYSTAYVKAHGIWSRVDDM